MSTTAVERPITPGILPARRVRSEWAKTAPLMSGTFTPKEWDDAGVMPIPAGYLMVKNDNNFLYLALDLTGDTGKSAGVGDYFWLDFDVDGNAHITPNKDVLYGIYPTLPIRMARSFCLGPGVWTTILTDPSTSLVRQGFAASPHSPVPHRIWEMRIALSEVGIHLHNLATPPVLRFGLRVSSTTPKFTYDFPVNFYRDFSNLKEILLSTGPALPATKGLAIAGVGIIPGTAINPATGRATTAKGYFISIQNGAFGGTIHVKGDEQTLTALYNQGARKYHVKIGLKGAAKTLLLQTWLNYKKAGPDWLLENFVPDADGKYVLPAPGNQYSIDHLLAQWSTFGVTGLYEVETEFFTASGALVQSAHQVLPIFIDNNLPDVRILGVRYKNKVIAPCDIVSVDESPDPVQIHIRAFDPEGDMYAYTLNAYYGDNQIFSPPLAQQIYTGTTPDWKGVDDTWISAGTPTHKFPPITCAYQFRLSATPRVTNGYDYIGYAEDTMHVTLQRPGAPHVTALRFAKEQLMGFTGPEGSFVKGQTPEKLG